MRSDAIDLQGRRIFRWSFISYVGQGKWQVICDCGATGVRSAQSIRRGQSKSCGCHNKEVTSARKTHGKSGSTEYTIWRGILNRCNNPKDKRYKDYGGRGITVDPNWLKFENFYADMGDRPSLEHSIDRIDNDGNYNKANCKWSTNLEQSRNSRTSKQVDYQGKPTPLGEVADALGLHKNTLYYRLYVYKWPLSRALTKEGR